jgi:hypothetical protein
MAAMHRAVRAVRELHDEVVAGTEAVQRAAGMPWHPSAPPRPVEAGADPARSSGPDR